MLTFFANRVFIDVITLKLHMLDEGGLLSNDWCPYRKREKLTQTHRKIAMWEQRQRSVTHRAKEHQGLLAYSRNQEEERKDCPQDPSERAQTCWHLDFRFLPPSRAVVSNHPVCATLLRSPSKHIQPGKSLDLILRVTETIREFYAGRQNPDFVLWR